MQLLVEVGLSRKVVFEFRILVTIKEVFTPYTKIFKKKIKTNINRTLINY